ncbi:aspartate kinase [Pyrococcus kukulkanii]|uniref:aspartate kinase n=1 Tax=Pyrococcus kukulkanii TaxID=1609559 RepID=UPI003569FE37
MIVFKFGGSSMRLDFQDAVSLVASLSEENEVAVVVSALKGVTDDLIRYADSLNQDLAVKVASEYIYHAKLNGIDPSVLKPYIDRLFTLPDLEYPALRDYILSIGELLSAVLFASAVGGKVILGEEIFIARGEFGDAFIDIEKSRRNVKLVYEVLEDGFIPVVPGFTANLDGRVATLGRGGSDYSAVALGALLNAELVVIMSDVDGIYTADPRIIPMAKLIPHLSYDEALLASRYGMRAIQWKASKLAKDFKLTVLFGRTRNWRMGTVLSEKSSGMPLMTFTKDRLLLINVTEDIGYDPIEEGPYWKLYALPESEALAVVRELHKRIFPPTQSIFQFGLDIQWKSEHYQQVFIKDLSQKRNIIRKFYYEGENVEPSG